MVVHLAQHIPRRLTVAFVMALTALAFVSIIAFTIDRGTSYVETPSASAMSAVINKDVVSPLAATGSSIVTITDASIAIASKTATDNGILTTSGLLLLAAIGAIYLIENGTGGRFRHLSRRVKPASRGIGMYTFGYGKLRVIAENVFTTPTVTVLKDLVTPPARTPTRTPTRSVTFLRSHGGAAYAASIALLAVALIGVLVQTTGISLA